MNRQSIILRAERIFKTDIRYVGKNGFWLMLGQAIAVTFGLMTSVAFANLLPQHEYGVYKFIFAVASVLGALQLSGLRQSVVQAVARGFDSTVLRAVITSLKWSSIMVGFGFLIAGYYYLQGNTTFALGIILVTITNALVGSLGLYKGYLGGKEKFKLVTLHQTALMFTNSSAVVVALLVTDNILYIILAHCISTISVLLVLSFSVLKNINHNTKSSSTSMRFGKHLSVQGFFVTIAQHADKIILFQFLGSVELARYMFALLLPDQLRTTVNNIFNIVIPRYSTKDDSALRESIRKKLFPFTTLLMIPAIIYILLAPYIYHLLFPVYEDVVIFSQIFALEIIMIPTVAFIGTYFNVREKTQILYVCKISSSIARVIFITLGVFFYGIIGAVVAVLFARLFQVLVFGFYYLKVPVENTEPVKLI